MKSLFAASSGLFSAVPGLLVLWKGIGVPPDHSAIFGGVIEALGAITFILLWVNQRKIKKTSSSKIVKYAIGLCGIGLLSLILYLVLFNWCVISEEGQGTAYFPLWTDGDLATMVESSGGRHKALNGTTGYGLAAIEDAVKEMPPYAIPITTALLLLVYQSIFTSLAAAFGLLGFHKGKGLITSSRVGKGKQSAFNST